MHSGGEWQHTTVLLAEAIESLLTTPDGVYVDGTFGRGGHSRALLARLSPRERDVARQLALGLSNKEVARQLSISDHTVHVHRQRITEKTGSGHAADLARLILRADPQALDEGSAPPPAM